MYRIYLVEDDKGLQKSIRDTLMRWGYEVFVVEDYNWYRSRVCENRTPFSANGYYIALL